MDIWSVLEYTMTAAVVGMLLWVFKLIFRDRLDARWHFFIWLVLLVRLALPVGVGHIRTSLSVFQELPIGKWLEKARIVVQKNGFEDLDDLLGSVYLCGALLLGSYYLLAWLALRIWIWRAPKADAETKEYVETIGRKYGLKACRDIRVCKSDTPYVFGVIFPVLVLPEDDIRPGEPIIVHELLHNKYKDVLVNILLHLVRVVHWINPAIWVLADMVQNDNEALCDQRVLERCGECGAAAYGEMLISRSEGKKRNFARVGTSNVSGSYRHMKIRISRIRNFGRISAGVGFVAVCMIVMLAAVSADSEEVYGFEAPESSELRTEKALERAFLEARCYHAHTPEEALYLFLLAVVTHNPVYRMAVMPQEEMQTFEECAKLWLDRKNLPWRILEEGYPAYFPQNGLVGSAAIYNLRTEDGQGSAIIRPNVLDNDSQVEWKVSLKKEEGWTVWLEEERVLDREESKPEPLVYGRIRKGDYLVECSLYNEGFFDQFYGGTVTTADSGEMDFPIYFSGQYKHRRIELTYLGEESLEGHQVRVVTAMGEGDLDQVERESEEELEMIQMSFGEEEIESKEYRSYSNGMQKGSVSVFDGKELMTGENRLVDGLGDGFSEPGGGWKTDEEVRIQIRIYVDGVIAEECQLLLPNGITGLTKDTDIGYTAGHQDLQ